MPYTFENPVFFKLEYHSYLVQIIYDGTSAGGMLCSYAQVCFSYAEAHRGWTGLAGDAQRSIRLGIAASHDQWGVAPADAAACSFCCHHVYYANNGY